MRSENRIRTSLLSLATASALLITLCPQAAALEPLTNAPDCVRWLQRTDVGSPGSRGSPAMAYDSDRGVTVLFGGSTFAEYFGDTWEYDGTVWRQIAVDGPSPSPRMLGAMCYDSVRREMVLVGGFNEDHDFADGHFKDTWVYRGNGPGRGVWTRKNDINRGGTPDENGRAGHAVVFDSRRGVAVMVGGTTGENSAVGAPDTDRVSEVWEWDGASWHYFNGLFDRLTRRSYEGPSNHAMAYDSDTGIISMSGGAYYYFLTEEFDSWSDLDWGRLLPIFKGEFYYSSGIASQPIGGADIGDRQQHAMVYDSHRKRLVIFGGGIFGEGTPPGTRDPGNLHDEAVYNPSPDGSPRYSAMRLAISTPPARERHAMVYDTRRQRTVLFGGVRGNTLYGDTWEYGIGAVPVRYVDARNSGTQNGSPANPHRTVRQAAALLDDCPTVLSIHAGDYLENALLINKPVRLEARNGSVRIH